jgi:hypothetical protein
MSHIKRDVPDSAIALRRSAGQHQRLAERSVKSAANDNDNQGPWPLAPFLESPYPTCSFEDVTKPQHSSWKGKLIRLAYVAATPIAVFGWLYLLWLAMISSTEWITN